MNLVQQAIRFWVSGTYGKHVLDARERFRSYNLHDPGPPYLGQRPTALSWTWTLFKVGRAA